MISAIPVVGDADPLSVEAMERGRELATRLCGDGRVLIQGHAVPDVGPIDAAIAAMADVAAAHQLSAWKVYTHSPNGWFLDDHDPALPQVGAPFIQAVRDTGVGIISVHKGLAGGNPYASPVDIGPAAAANPDVRFLVYHSGYDTGTTEGPFDPDGTGVDRLVRSVTEAGIGPGGNVYAELGSTWRTVMGDPDAAAHVLGKLLVAFGPERILWGTDSIWYGSPQDQIAAFRAFEITPAYQEQFGYPALTPDVKQRIMADNAAELLGITVPAADLVSRSSRPSNRTSGRWPAVTWSPRSCASTPGSPRPSVAQRSRRGRASGRSVRGGSGRACIAESGLGRLRRRPGDRLDAAPEAGEQPATAARANTPKQTIAIGTSSERSNPSRSPRKGDKTPESIDDPSVCMVRIGSTISGHSRSISVAPMISSPPRVSSSGCTRDRND